MPSPIHLSRLPDDPLSSFYPLYSYGVSRRLPSCRPFTETESTGDESSKRAAQEYLAAKRSKEGQSYEDRMNQEAAEKLLLAVAKNVASTIRTKCRQSNEITGEQTFSVRETMLGDLRILCAGRSQRMMVKPERPSSPIDDEISLAVRAKLVLGMANARPG